MARIHDKDCFYKYVSADTAIKILTTKKLRYSSPLLFNDPFDHHIELQLGFTEDDFRDLSLKEWKSIICGEKTVTFDTSCKLGTMFNERLPTDDPTTRTEILDDMKNATEETAKNLPALRIGYNRAIREAIQANAVLCVSEVKNNILMWSHYASNHTGAVFQIRCVEEVDNSVLAAKRVRYVNELPLLASLDDFIKLSTGQTARLASNEAHVDNIIYTKSEEWSYEQEWRVVIFGELSNGNLFIDLTEAPSVFGAVYLGCMIEDGTKQEIVDLVKADQSLQHLEIYQANKSKTDFALDFERIR